jgi:hypothetical protein
MALFDIWRSLCLRLHEICAIRRFVRRCELQRGSPAIAISIGGRPERAEVNPVQGRTFSIGVGFGKGCRASMAYRDSLADGCTHRRVVGELAMRATDAQEGRERAHRHTRTDVFHRLDGRDRTDVFHSTAFCDRTGPRPRLDGVGGVYRMRRLPLFFERLAVRDRPDPVRGSLTRGAGVPRRSPATLTSSSRPGHRIPSPSPRSSHFWR